MEICLRVAVPGSDGVTWKIGDRPFSEIEFKSLLRMFAKGDDTYHVRVLCGTNASASQLVATIAAIQEAGLHNVTLVCEGTNGGTNGIYKVRLNCATSEIPFFENEGDGTFLSSGFFPSGQSNAWVRGATIVTNELGQRFFRYDVHGR